MAAVTAEPESDVLLLRRAARIASRVKAELDVVHVIVGDTTLSRDGRSIDGLRPLGLTTFLRSGGAPRTAVHVVGLPGVCQGQRHYFAGWPRGTARAAQGIARTRVVLSRRLACCQSEDARHHISGLLRRCLPVIRGRQPA